MNILDMTKQLSISLLNWAQLLKNHLFIIICGVRNTGKSVLVKNIVHEAHVLEMSRCVIFTHVDPSVSHEHTAYMPQSTVRYPITVESLEEVWNAQQQLVRQEQQGILPPHSNVSLLIVLDSAAHDSTLMKSKVLREMTLNHKSFSVTLIMTAQYILHFDVAMRSSADVGIFLQDGNQSTRKKIWNDFGGCFDKLSEFNKVFEACTGNYEAFCVNRRARSYEISDVIHYYKGSNDLDFMFGTE